MIDILAFGAHPDDVELGCAGTLAKAIKNGKKVGIIDLTQGELGTRGSKEIRAMETQKASDILGVLFRENVGFRDGFFVNDEAHQIEIIKRIRKYQPKIVLANAISDRHIDHAKGSKLVSDACFLAGLTKIETSFEGKLQQAFRPQVVYHYIQWESLQPDFVVNISDTIQQKIEAVMAYQSQFYDEKSTEPVTPIATKNFIDSIEYRAKDLGRLIGVDYAEGFTIERFVAVENITDLI